MSGNPAADLHGVLDYRDCGANTTWNLQDRLAKLESVHTDYPANLIHAAEKPINPDFASTLLAEPRREISRRLVIAVMAFMVWAASVAMIAIVPALFLLPYLASVGIAITDSGKIVEFAKSDQTAIFLQVAAIVPAHILTVVVAYFVVARGRKFAFLRSLGWENGGVKWWHHVAILVAFFVIAGIVNYAIPEQDNELLRLLRSSRVATYAVALIATFSAPFVEEVIYRGVLYSAFEKAFGVSPAFILVTILFALVHVPQYFPSYGTILLLTLLSVTLTALRIWSNNIWPCVVLHTVFNGIQSILLILEPHLTQLDQPIAR